MNAVKQAIWLFCTLILLTVLSFYMAKNSIINTWDAIKLENIVDTVVLNLSVRKFDIYGNIVHKLYTPQLQRVPKNNSYYLQLPRVIVLNKDQSNWKISANYANTLYGFEQIIFHNNVVVTQKKLVGKINNIMHTEKLIFYSNKKSVV